MKIKKIKLILAAILTLDLLSFSFTGAASNGLPVIMHGQTTYQERVADPSIGFPRAVYGGMTGNEAVLNFNPDYLIGFDNGFDNDAIGFPLWRGPCYNQGFNSISYLCFRFPVAQTGLSAVRVLNSRTSVNLPNGNPIRKLETAALVYSSRTISGDAYSLDNFLNNFLFWGRNLAGSAVNGVNYTQATWKFGNYIQNQEAQSTWNSAQTTEYKEKIKTLARSGKSINLPDQLGNSTKSWSLQSSQMPYNYRPTENDGAGADKNLYPEGKVWVVNGDLSIANNVTVTYYGTGTIIINGNFYVGLNAKILPHDSTSDHLGIIIVNGL